MGFAKSLLLYGTYITYLWEELNGLWHTLFKNDRNCLSLLILHASVREGKLDILQQRGFSKKSPIIKLNSQQ